MTTTPTPHDDLQSNSKPTKVNTMNTTLTVGRVVWYWVPATQDNVKAYPRPALIAHVWNDHCINLGGFDNDGRPFSARNVLFRRDGDERPLSEFAEWPHRDTENKDKQGECVQGGAEPFRFSPPLKGSMSSNEAEAATKASPARHSGPRITPNNIEMEIASEHYFTAAEGCRGEEMHRYEQTQGRVAKEFLPESLQVLTFCVLVLRNGFTVTGESACAAPVNFDAALGKKLARDNAIRKVWPLMGYALRSLLSYTETHYSQE